MRATLALVVALVATAGTARARTRYTLQQLYDLAKQASTVKIAQAQVEQAEAQKRDVLYNWAPTGEARYAVTLAPRIQCQASPGTLALYGNDPSKVPQSVRQNDCATTIDPANQQNVSTFNPNVGGIGMQIDFNFVQPLFSFGKIEYGTRAAGHGVDAAVANVETARRDVMVRVAQAYWGLKASRAAIATVEEGKGEIVPWVKKIEDDIDNNPKSKYTLDDLQRLKLALGGVDNLLANLQKNADKALGGLQVLTGPDGDIDDNEIDTVPLPEVALDAYESGLAVHRPELLQIKAGLLGLEDVAREKLAEMLPDLGLAVGMTWRYAPSIEDSTSAFVTHANVLGIGAYLALREPLDLAQRYSHWRHAQADAAVMAAQKRALLDGMKLEVRSAYADLSEARKRLKITDKMQVQARGWLNMVKQNVDLGTAEPRTLVEAARAYFENRLGYLQAINDVNVAAVVLEKAAGEAPR